MKIVEFKIESDEIERFERYLGYEKITIISHIIDPGSDGFDYYRVDLHDHYHVGMLGLMLEDGIKFEMKVK